MHRLNFDSVETILVIGAHPDDIEIGCGGTLLRLLAEQPRDVHWVTMSGAAERHAEGQASAERFLRQARTREIRVENFRDAYFPAQYTEIKDYFAELSRQVSPDLIFTHHRSDLHQDHRLLAELTWNAFRDHLILEYEIAKYEGDLGHPNVLVSLTEKQCDEKVAAIIESFPSQAGKRWFSDDSFRALMRLRGVEGDAETLYAEGFHCPKLVV